MLQLEEVSAKVRTGPPKDDAKDMSLPIWAGVLNIRQCTPASAVADPQLAHGIDLPDYVTNYRRPSKQESGSLEM